MPQQRSRSLKFAVAVVALAAIAAVALSPLLAAGLVGDDWGMMLAARLIDSPLSLYTQDYSATYVYRPNGMLLWWLSVVAFDNAPLGHYLLSIGLHVLNASLLLWFLARAGTGYGLAFPAAAVFAIHPIGAGTTAWLSDRFDLLAAGAVLWMLIALGRAIEQRRVPIWAVVAAAVAIGSKEIAVAGLACAAVRLLLAHEFSLRQRLGYTAMLLSPLLLFLLARQFVVPAQMTSALLADPIAALLTGSSFWLTTLPLALGGGHSAVAGWLLLAILLAALIHALTRPSRSVLVPVCAAAVLFLSPAVIQAPITQLALGPGGLETPPNFRFYYLAFAGLLGLVALSLRNAPAWLSRSVAIGLVLVIALVATRSREMSAIWAQATSLEQRPTLSAAIDAARQLQPTSRCRVQFSGGEPDLDIPGFLDVAIKAQLPAEHPLLGCVLHADQAPYFSLTTTAECDNAAWASLAPHTYNGTRVDARKLPGMCILYFGNPLPALTSDHPELIVLHWRDGVFVRNDSAQ